MFRGQFIHAVDPKGRVSMPARFRDQLLDQAEPSFVVTPALFDPCLHLYPMRAWQEFEAKVAELPSLDPHVVRFRRLYVSAAHECELDGSGRLLVPPNLRARIDLHREALFAGMGKNLELWSKDNWDKALELGPKEEAAFRRAVMEQIRV